MSETMELIIAIYVKFKILIYSILAAYVAATMRYFKQKRQGREPNVSGWFAFGVTSFLVTYSFYSAMEYLDYKLPENLVVAMGFWVGYMADFFYSWIPNFIKSKLPINNQNQDDENRE